MRASYERAVQPGPVLEVQPCWYACYTRARHEKKVDRLLRQQGVESYLPLVRQRHRWSDREKEVVVALFPSYVFARFSLTAIAHVLATPGITTLVRSNGRPVALPDEEVANVRYFAEAMSRIAVHPRLETLPPLGARVRIVGGPFMGVAGIVMDYRNRGRVLVGLSAIGMGVQVEVDADMVERAT
jgi:transcription antitermination factor NusG